MANVIFKKRSYARFNLSMNLKNTRAKLLILSPKKATRCWNKGNKYISHYNLNPNYVTLLLYMQF